MKNFTRKQKPVTLEMHRGCKGCTAKCIFNKPVTTRFKNQQTPNMKYGCNTSKVK